MLIWSKRLERKNESNWRNVRTCHQRVLYIWEWPMIPVDCLFFVQYVPWLIHTPFIPLCVYVQDIHCLSDHSVGISSSMLCYSWHIIVTSLHCCMLHSALQHTPVRPVCPIYTFRQFLHGTLYAILTLCWIGIGSLGFTNIASSFGVASSSPSHPFPPMSF